MSWNRDSAPARTKLGIRPSRERLSALVLLALGACGYASSGEWTDDPENIRRAWGLDLPAGVALERSWYWRSPHFTVEESYYFQISRSPEIRASLVEQNGLERVDAADYPGPPQRPDGPTLDWFMPGDRSGYDAWCAPRDPGKTCWVFEDRVSGTWFVHAQQL